MTGEDLQHLTTGAAEDFGSKYFVVLSWVSEMLKQLNDGGHLVRAPGRSLYVDVFCL